MVGGLGKGGKSYYAIDVTSPTAVTDENTAAAQYLWTFTDGDMGYTYGRPFLTKTHATQGAFTAGQWVAVVSAGYNNPTGLGKIFFIDVKTGTKLKEMDTGFGSATSPSGLVHLVGYTKDYHNQLLEQIYGGDLYGNFWRFDVSDSDPGNWTVTKLAYLTDPTGVPQPVTVAPSVDVDITNGVDRWVFVGTGRLLDPTDLTDPLITGQQQTLYAIRDGTATTPSVAATPLLPRTDLVPLVDKVNGLSGKPTKGWYDDLPTGQRIVSPVKAALSLVAYAGTSAQDNPCLTGEPATLYVRSFATGESLVTDQFGVRIFGVDEPAGTVGLDVTVFSDSGSGGAAGPDIRIAVTTAAGTIIFQQTITQIGLANSRMSWRLFGQ
jgi:type IV pilus assembly protein PilY1